MRNAIVICLLLSGCATRGGALAGTGAVVSGMIAAAAVANGPWWCNQALPCENQPSTTTPTVFAALAGALGVTALLFETLSVVHPEEPAREHVVPAKLDCDTVAAVVHASPNDPTMAENPVVVACRPPPGPPPGPPTLSIVDALALAERYQKLHHEDVDPRQLQSRFDHVARDWMFTWKSAETLSVVFVHESGVVSGRRCALDAATPCTMSVWQRVP